MIWGSVVRGGGAEWQALWKDGELPGERVFGSREPLPPGSAVIVHSGLMHGRRCGLPNFLLSYIGLGVLCGPMQPDALFGCRDASLPAPKHTHTHTRAFRGPSVM